VFRSAVFSIRVKVDEVYRKLHHLCDVLEGLPQVSHDPSVHKLRISESNELLDGLKRLFDNSNTDEQIRLMTIAPNTWGGGGGTLKNGLYLSSFFYVFHLLNHLSISTFYIY